MTVIHVRKHENNFVMIDKQVLCDERLSWKAKGILVYLLSKPPDWIVQVADIIKQSTDGEHAVRAALNELIEIGYATRELFRNEDGRFDRWELVVYEQPVRDNRDVGFCDGENRDLNKNELTKNELTKNDSRESNSKSKNQNTGKETAESIIAGIEQVAVKSTCKTDTTAPRKTSVQDWKSRGAGVVMQSLAGANGKQDLSDYPEDIREVVGLVCELWHLTAVTRKTRQGKQKFGDWIDSARELVCACGELDYRDVLRKVRDQFVQHMDEHHGLAPYTVSRPGSLIEPVRATAGMIRSGSDENKCIVMPDGMQFYSSKTVKASGGSVIYPKNTSTGWND